MEAELEDIFLRIVEPASTVTVMCCSEGIAIERLRNSWASSLCDCVIAGCPSGWSSAVCWACGPSVDEKGARALRFA